MLKRTLLFYGLQSSGWFWFWLLSVIIAAGLIFALMRYERRLVTKRVGYVLLLLRLLVLGTFFLTMLQPVLAWTVDREKSGRIVVAIDLSESMDTSDNHASDLEKLRWALALEMLDADESQIEIWQDDFAAGREPQWVAESETSDPDRRAELAAVRRETIFGQFKELENLSRKELALRLLTETGHPLIDQLKAVADVEIRVFAGEVESADEETLSQFFETPPSSIVRGTSDLATALRTPSSGASDNTAILGVVLLSDGQDNGSNDPVNAAAQLGSNGTRVFPIVIGSEFTPRDLAIAEIEYPQSVFKDDKPLLGVSINTSGYEGTRITVALEKDGVQVDQRTIVPDGPVTNTEFELDGSSIGRKTYNIRVEPQPGETRDDNNEQSFAMNVVDDNVEVLLIEGEARWEFRFLHNALERDKRVSVDNVVFTQPYLGQLNDTYFARNLILPDDPKALDRSPFAESDLVIIGDVNPDSLAPAFWPLLERYVSESGGTVVFIAGKRHMPLQYRSPILDRLLPVEKLRAVDMNGRGETGSPTRRGLKIRLSVDGENEPMFQFDTDRLVNRRLWSELPGHMWALVGRAKPAATVLAHAFRIDDPPDGMQDERRNALIVQQNYGVGKVLWIGIDSTWRWRYRTGDKYHHRFWGQLGRWAADNKAAAGNEFVRFGPKQNDVDEGAEIILEARWTQIFFQRNPNLTARAQIYSADDDTTPLTTVDLVPSDQRPLSFTGRIAGLTPGEYRAELVVENANVGADPIEAKLYVHEIQTIELSELNSNRELLKSIAEASGGRVFEPNETADLASEFLDAEQTTQSREETNIWDHWSMMLLFFGLMTAEWVIRKLNGLP
jgi:hypothetical protein